MLLRIYKLVVTNKNVFRLQRNNVSTLTMVFQDHQMVFRLETIMFRRQKWQLQQYSVVVHLISMVRSSYYEILVPNRAYVCLKYLYYFLRGFFRALNHKVVSNKTE